MVVVAENSASQILKEIQEFLDRINNLAPNQQGRKSPSVIYRAVSSDEIVDDSLIPDENLDQNDFTIPDSPIEIPKPVEFVPTNSGPVVAVDCGMARLGETDNGLIIALRAAIVTDKNGKTDVQSLRTGPIFLHNVNKVDTFYEMGKQLGKPDLFVEIDNSDLSTPKPTHLKGGVAQDVNRYADRFRNWFERLAQQVAVNQIQDGTFLLDGALTLRTLDTPDIFFTNLARATSEQGNALVAISKRSFLQIQGKEIRFWLNDVPNKICYRELSSLLRQDAFGDRVLGNTYAIRFSPLGLTFRMDVKAAEGQSDNEAVNKLFSSVLMRAGYPDILVRAHMHSYFTSSDVIQLQAQASAQYDLLPQGEVDLSGIFGPFGGRFK